MNLEIPYWTSHHNMIIYAYLYYCEETGSKFQVKINKTIPASGAILNVGVKKIFLDYSDDRIFIENPKKFDIYFKRSLLPEARKDNILPLSFQANYSYKALKFLSTLSFTEIIRQQNRVEVARAMDYFNVLTNWPQNAGDVRKVPTERPDNNGRVIFHTRLWNPDNNPHQDEKERRHLQNKFRIGACRIIKDNFADASVGIFPDAYASKVAPDIMLDSTRTSKKEFFDVLKKCDIGVADDGLKDTPGWKISEYLLFGKSLISTPFNVIVENFHETINYMGLSTRVSYDEIPDKVEYLLKDRKYTEMGNENLKWSDEYLHPKNYLFRILKTVENYQKG